MRIVQVSPDFYPVPPKNYGGIERVVFDLTEELVRKGHEVYLYAPQGSQSSATIIPYQHSGGNAHAIAEYVIRTLPKGIDIIHDHTHLSVIGQINLPTPTVCTIHDDSNHLVKNSIYLCKRVLEVIGGNEGFFVYNGLNPDVYEFSEQRADYLLFLGALGWHKGVHHAIEIAEVTNQTLYIAGPIFDYEFFANILEPRIQGNPNIHYVGEVGGSDKQYLLKHAKCMLFPTLWEEPFGLVMIEAMACGTPVLALGHGAVPEVLSGFPQLVNHSMQEMAQKVLLGEYPMPKELREYVIKNFSRSIMADQYIEIYEKVIGQS